MINWNEISVDSDLLFILKLTSVSYMAMKETRITNASIH
jgi:hypothetical protein